MKNILSILLTAGFVWNISTVMVLAEENPTPASDESSVNEYKKEYQEYLAQIQEERAKETDPFKKKAIAQTEKREKKYQEILKRKEEKASVFQKKAETKIEKEEKTQQLKSAQRPKSRFTEMAEKRLKERELKQKLREEKLHGNRKK